MKVQELSDILKSNDFNMETLDSGYNYTKKVGHISLNCYIEPNMGVEFISIYHWNNNDVKGTYNISIEDLSRSKDNIEALFRKTKNNMPQHIGEFIDTHELLEKAIEHVFK